jgi:2-hydroxychromene-2-carboxylate isomerase
MGVVIELKDQLSDRSRPRKASRGAFFYDLACPFSYLAAERIERELGQVDWIPVPGAALNEGARWARLGATRAPAERQATALRLPLVWPELPRLTLPQAMRAATYAAEHGAGSRFALAAARLAFCGGFDLEDPEILGIAAAAAAVPLAACLAAAQDGAHDAVLAATARGLRQRGLRRLPVIRLGRRWWEGTQALEAAAVLARVRAL